MPDQKPMLVYAAIYGSVAAAETDLDAIEALHKDKVIGSFDAAIIEIARKCIPEGECIVDRGGGLGLGCQLRACLFQPSSHVVEQRPGPCATNRAAFLRRSPLDLLLDPVEGGDALNSFGCDGRVVRLQQVEELASDVRHARCLLNRSAFVKLIKTCEGVGLQDAFKLGQMALRVFSLAVRRIGEPHRRRGVITCRAVVANIGPEAAGLGLARSRSEHRKRRIVSVQLVCVEHVATQHFGHRLKQRCNFTHPTGENRAIQIDTFACKDLRLSM